MSKITGKKTRLLWISMYILKDLTENYLLWNVKFKVNTIAMFVNFDSNNQH